MESVLIFRGGKNVLNSKSEFSRCTVPRLGVTFGDKHIDAGAVSKVEEKLKWRSADSDLSPSKPAKRRRKRGQYEQSRGPNETGARSVTFTAVTGDAELPHGHGGGQPTLQHHDPGHSLGQQDGGDNRAVPTFKNIVVPHTTNPRPTTTDTRTSLKSRGTIKHYFKTANGKASRDFNKPNHPT